MRKVAALVFVLWIVSMPPSLGQEKVDDSTQEKANVAKEKISHIVETLKSKLPEVNKLLDELMIIIGEADKIEKKDPVAKEEIIKTLKDAFTQKTELSALTVKVYSIIDQLEVDAEDFETTIAQLDIDEIEVSFDVPNSIEPSITELHYLVIKPTLYFQKDRDGAAKAIKNAIVIKTKIKDIVRVMLENKGYSALKKPGALDEIKLDIKDRINQELKLQVVREVAYDDLKWR